MTAESIAGPSEAASAPGWYVDPSGVAPFRFWDGARWTRHTSPVVPDPGRPAAQAGPPPSHRWYTLSTVVQVALAVVIVTQVVTIAGQVHLHRLAAAWPEIPLSVETLASFNAVRFAAFAQLGYYAAVLVTGVLFIVWLYRAHHSRVLDPARLRHGSGWAIGGWFVPVLNLWRPCQMVRDVYRTADASGRDSALVLTWWLAWLGAQGLHLLAGQLVETTGPVGQETMDDLVRATDVGIMAATVDLAAAALAILVVQQVRDAVRTATVASTLRRAQDDASPTTDPTTARANVTPPGEAAVDG